MKLMIQPFHDDYYLTIPRTSTNKTKKNTKSKTKYKLNTHMSQRLLIPPPSHTQTHTNTHTPIKKYNTSQIEVQNYKKFT